MLAEELHVGSRMTTIALDDLLLVTGAGPAERLRSAVHTAARTTDGFMRGAAAGVIFGETAKASQIEMFGNRNEPGFRPGVETGMMLRMAVPFAQNPGS